jgi:hypothetical protein
VRSNSEPNNDGPEKHANLSVDLQADGNVITRKLARQILQRDLQPRDKEGKAHLVILGVRFELLELVRISWCIPTKPETFYEMDCYVVETKEPLFDVVAGREQVENNQLLQQIAGTRRKDKRNRPSHGWRQLVFLHRKK